MSDLFDKSIRTLELPRVLELLSEQAVSAEAKQRAAASARRLAEKPRRRPADVELSAEDEKLLADLYALRKRLASKQKIPAYLVFSDATLREMVQKKPFSTDELLNITGVGEKKAARYGTIFLAAIEEAVAGKAAEVSPQAAGATWDKEVWLDYAGNVASTTFTLDDPASTVVTVVSRGGSLEAM